MRHVVIIVFILLFSSCSKPSLSELMNKAIQEKQIREPLSKDVSKTLNISNGTNICFLFDASCSSCIGDYFNFVEEVKKCNYDSLYTIACGANDFLLIEHYMTKFKIDEPQRQHIVFDANKSVLDKFMQCTGIYDIIITKDESVIYKGYLHDFTNKPNKGMILK